MTAPVYTNEYLSDSNGKTWRMYINTDGEMVITDAALDAWIDGTYLTTPSWTDGTYLTTPSWTDETYVVP